MNKRGKNIIFWIITWASLLLLVLYSPIGSPDLYRSDEYFVQSRGVSFEGMNLKNQAKFNTGNDNSSGSISLQVPNSVTSNTINYSYNNSYANSSSVNNHDLAQQSPYQTDYSNSSQSNYNYMGGDNYMYLKSGAKSVYTSPKISNVTITSDLLINQQDNNTSPLLAKTDVTGGTDPGGDPGNPIPVGDGWEYLLLLAVGYASIRYRIFLKK